MASSSWKKKASRLEEKAWPRTPRLARSAIRAATYTPRATKSALPIDCSSGISSPRPSAREEIRDSTIIIARPPQMAER